LFCVRELLFAWFRARVGQGVDLHETQVGGDISGLATVPRLRWLDVRSTQVGGTLQTLVPLTDKGILRYLDVRHCSKYAPYRAASVLLCACGRPISDHHAWLPPSCTDRAQPRGDCAGAVRASGAPHAAVRGDGTGAGGPGRVG